MQRHGFDALSFFFGALFVALAASVLFIDGLDAISGRWVWPVVLILGGVAMLTSMFTGRSRASAVDEPAAATDQTSEDATLLAEAAAELPDELHFR